MRLCLDADCVLSGIASPGGATGRVLRNIAHGRLTLVISPPIREEYHEAVIRPRVAALFRRRGVTPELYTAAVERLCGEAESIMPTGDAPPCRDEKDRKYLHCALQGHVEYLLSWDDDLLDMGTIGEASILKAGEFLTAMRARGLDLDP